VSDMPSGAGKAPGDGGEPDNGDTTAVEKGDGFQEDYKGTSSPNPIGKKSGVGQEISAHGSERGATKLSAKSKVVDRARFKTAGAGSTLFTSAPK